MIASWASAIHFLSYFSCHREISVACGSQAGLSTTKTETEQKPKIKKIHKKKIITIIYQINQETISYTKLNPLYQNQTKLKRALTDVS